MDKNEVMKAVADYSELVSKRLKPNKILLYGSYVKGNWHKDSDIDIAIVVDTIGDDYLEIASMLYQFRRNIDDRIEPVLLEEGRDPTGFLKEILRHGEVIYSS